MSKGYDPASGLTKEEWAKYEEMGGTDLAGLTTRKEIIEKIKEAIK